LGVGVDTAEGARAGHSGCRNAPLDRGLVNGNRLADVGLHDNAEFIFLQNRIRWLGVF
jgi:hypothetical protein